MDWYAWGDEAFRRARDDDKPVFLSIGYATCHWCHVMEHESFEDERVAALMNEAFVSIKVDREERPDIDEHFMRICQLLTGAGGWPLTMILTPEGKPFFAATYIPKDNAYGRTGMLELIPEIAQVWAARRAEVDASAEAIGKEIVDRVHEKPGGVVAPDPEAAGQAARQLSRIFDSANGGFGDAPKFPMPVLFPLLLRAWDRGRDPEALRMVEQSLTAMRNGGIYDQAGFGFHRYSTDAHWLVPHFEKMLYDQALLLLAYTETWQAVGSDFYRHTAEEIAAYVLRDMTSPEGAFYSAEDADSDGEEGRFYTWTEQEADAALGPERGQLVKTYGVLAPGQNILHRDPADTSTPGRLEQLLFAAREGRNRPFKDDKVLADWNGLMIAALARAGGAFDEQGLIAAAGRAADFVLHRMSPDGRLCHRFRDGETAITAFAEDHAFLAWGLLELYEAGFEERFLSGAVDVMQALIQRYWDPDDGGFFRTAADAPQLPGGRVKPLTDGVIPSANSVALLVLLKLARITGSAEYQQMAEAVMRLSGGRGAEDPYSHAFFLCAMDMAAGPFLEIVVAGAPGAG
ncbi:MAG: thioredoxin domain-containing protein, partial [Spirochaetia bacterium]